MSWPSPGYDVSTPYRRDECGPYTVLLSEPVCKNVMHTYEHENRTSRSYCLVRGEPEINIGHEAGHCRARQLLARPEDREQCRLERGQPCRERDEGEASPQRRVRDRDFAGRLRRRGCLYQYDGRMMAPRGAGARNRIKFANAVTPEPSSSLSPTVSQPGGIGSPCGLFSCGKLGLVTPSSLR